MHESERRRLPSLMRGSVGVDSALWCLALICGCFTLTSEGYIEWLYRLMSLSPTGGADWHALVGNYLFQGMGMLLASLHMRRDNRPLEPPLLLAALVLHASFAAPAALVTTKAAAVVFGSLMALTSGFVQSCYLSQLMVRVEPGRRGVVFGVGYACSSGITWLLSFARGLTGQTLSFGLVTCFVFTAATAALVLLTHPIRQDEPSPQQDSQVEVPDATSEEVPVAASTPADGLRTTIVYASALVLLMSTEKSLGFGFPPTDIALGVSVEFSRLFYAAGLVAAGIAADYNRSYGVVCGMAAMITPFALLALSGEPVSGTVLWSLDYLLYGFFALFRVMFFLDLATSEDKAYLAGFGLMLGRWGDAAGNALCLALVGSNVALVGLAGVMLVCSILVALQVIPRLYAPEPTIVSTIVYRPAPRSPEEDRLGRFCQYYDLSRREQEVLGQVLDRHTNVEAAEQLFVSESTVKFHMRNLLRKTGCRNRVELRELYVSWQ